MSRYSLTALAAYTVGVAALMWAPAHDTPHPLPLSMITAWWVAWTTVGTLVLAIGRRRTR